MKNYFIGLILIIFGIAILQYGLRPWMLKNEAVKTLTTILHLYENGDFTLVSKFWTNPLNVPPIAKINRYKIVSSEALLKQKRPQYFFRIVLNFDSRSDLPSGKIWSIVMVKTSDGWKVDTFDLEKQP
jgi:hypothetical protein